MGLQPGINYALGVRTTKLSCVFLYISSMEGTGIWVEQRWTNWWSLPATNS